jgi:single stranded DNA-binding protein
MLEPRAGARAYQHTSTEGSKLNGITAALTGRLGADGILKYTSNGNPFLTIRVAVDDAKRGEGDQTEWVKVTVWGEAVEQLAPRLLKGVSIYAEGRLRLDLWSDREGKQRWDLSLRAWVCEPLGQIGRRRPSGPPIPLGAGTAGQPRRMPEAMAVGGRDMRQVLGLDDDDDPEGLPFP